MPKVEGLTPAQAGALVQLSRLTPFRKLQQKISGNAEFKTWLESVAGEQDVPEVWDVDKPLSKCIENRHPLRKLIAVSSSVLRY